MHSFQILPILFCVVFAAPKLRVMPDQVPAQLLTLPSNATSIRTEISDSFSCDGREYGYYADVENDCQLFHVCLPVTHSNGRQQTFRWSFICPDDTVFNQEIFTCTRSDESINCADSPRFYSLNRSFGEVEEHEEILEESSPQQVDDATSVPEIPQAIEDTLEQRHPAQALRRSSKY
ncbi:hypothetical protein Trydic_g1986 [Trypoxylus dichotomus]